MSGNFATTSWAMPFASGASIARADSTARHHLGGDGHRCRARNQLLSAVPAYPGIRRRS